MNTASLRSGFAAIALIAIAACSAAGGQNSSAVPTSGMGPAGVNAAGHHRRRPPAKTQQRAIAASALSVAGASMDLDQFGSANGLLSQLLHFGHDVAHTRHHADPHDAGTCNNGVEYTYSSSGLGQVSQTIDFFYDAACTEPFNFVTLNATFTSSGGSAQGTQETWDTNGNVIGYNTYTATFTPGASGGIGEILVQKTSAPAPSSSPTSQSGFTCLFNTGNAVDCGAGNVTNVALASPLPEEVGFTETVVGTFVTASPAPSTKPSGGPSSEPSASPSASPSAQPTKTPPDWGHGGPGHGGPPGHGWQGGPSGLELTINGAGYSGAIGSLILAAGTPPAWTITGGTQDGTLTGTATIGFGGYEHSHGGGWHSHWGHGGGHGNPGPGCMTSIDITLTDTADGLTVAITSAGFGKLTGAVTETAGGTAVATMSLDYSGTGTITYTNGQVDQVQDWIIVN